MKKEYFKKVVLLMLVIVAAYAFHELLFFVLDINTLQFVYSLQELYAFFTILTIAIAIVLFRIQRKSFDNVGMSFLLLTNLKMLFCFFMLRPILKTVSDQNNFEKINFFALFIFFLIIETLFAIRLVNEKQN